MTRRTARLFVAVVICLFTTVPVSLVSAEDSSAGGGGVIVNVVTTGSSCTGIAQEHCEQIAAANDILLRVSEAASPVHTLSANGVGQ